MSRLHFFGWLIIACCILLTGTVVWSRPKAGFQFLRNAGVPRVAYDSGEIEMRYYPLPKESQMKSQINSEMSARGFSPSKDSKGHTEYTKGNESMVLVPKEYLKNPRMEVIYRRPASLLETVLHSFWDQ